jgi:hypothetical protein
MFTQVTLLQAVTVRYAIVIGNNIGVDANGHQPFPPLKHAEVEARRLKEQLVGMSNFDATNLRTILLSGATKDDVHRAFEEIRVQKKSDHAMFSQMESIFLFYFTGHGLENRLLLKDGPLTSEELVHLFKSVDADLSVGIFDACYSGSLDGLLDEKGIRRTPGLNMIENLPQEILSAKGNVWYVSSGAGEPSFEDSKIGGIFTHYFIEALKEAEQDGPGITLDSIWQYVRRKTSAYAASRNRHQVPEQLISRFRARAPVYFSFPMERSAKLALSEKLSGRFALSYAEGNLLEIIEKTAGEKKELAVYPGDATLRVLDTSSVNKVNYKISLREGNTVTLQSPTESSPPVDVGHHSSILEVKGLGDQTALKVTMVASGVTLLGGVGYGISFAGKEMLHPRHRISVAWRLDRSPLFAAASIVYGIDKRDPEEWSWAYFAQLFGGELFGGYSWRLKKVQVFLGPSLFVGGIWRTFDDESKIESSWELHLQGKIGMLFPKTGSVLFALSGEAGPIYSPGAAAGRGNMSSTAGGISVTGYFRLF